MMRSFNNLPDVYQGVIYIIAGLTVLLYALGFIQTGLNLVVILFACCLLFIGVVRSGLYGRLEHMMKKHSRK
jgi:hypothetical protein